MAAAASAAATAAAAAGRSPALLPSGAHPASAGLPSSPLRSMVGWRDSNGDLIARALSSKPRPYDAGGDGGKGLSHLCLERLAYVPVLPEVLRGAC